MDNCYILEHFLRRWDNKALSALTYKGCSIAEQPLFFRIRRS